MSTAYKVGRREFLGDSAWIGAAALATDSVFAAEADRRLRHALRENAEPRSLPAREQHGDHFFLNQASTSSKRYRGDL